MFKKFISPLSFILFLSLTVPFCNAANPISPRLKIHVDDKGMISGIRERGEYVFGTGKLNARIDKTFSKRTSQSLMFVVPQNKKFKLGTIIRRKTKAPYESFYDESAVTEFAKLKKVGKYPLATQFGMMQLPAMRLMFHPHSYSSVLKELRNEAKAPLTANAMAASMRIIRIETLNASDIQKKVARIKRSKTFNKNDYYVIVDKVILAKEIWYIYPPIHFQKSLSLNDFRQAEKKYDNVITDGQIGYVKAAWDDYKVVAVGTSIIPKLTQSGDRRIERRFQNQMLDSLRYNAKKSNNLFN